ncbi:Beta-fructofuranosidase, insoluble isoenzyme CWINV1 [Camellia lanceoleosa]|uniref:Beta-fructofuranosidase, insoluble isoenzyme CWINV1 n=1 Tax=Camellia lanceoleosa TaxID=1840588 RepID=A0ACC0FDJ8_9ERIC|nr:Beta-fructofuranosidase, insoluble isoenzyme CWINV1 [Camellia lanceoleosa]
MGEIRSAVEMAQLEAEKKHDEADVEISFEVLEIEKAELIDPSWTNPQLLCSQMDASVEVELGPFGLKVLASKDLIEHTSVFFRIFKA